MSASTGTQLILLGLIVLTALTLTLLLGPIGLLLVPLGLILAGFAMLVTGSDDGPPERVNCADCGSPNPADAEACDYCGAGL